MTFIKAFKNIYLEYNNQNLLLLTVFLKPSVIKYFNIKTRTKNSNIQKLSNYYNTCSLFRADLRFYEDILFKNRVFCK